MATIGELIVKFTADGSEFTKTLDSLSAEADKFGSQMTKVGSALTKYVTLPMVAAGAAAVTLAAQEQAAGARMEQALKNVGITNTKFIAGLNAQFTALQRVTTFADDEYVGAFTKLVGITKDADKSMKALAVAADIAATEGMDLESAAQLVGKALSGQTAMLKRHGIFLSESATQTQILEALTARFGGTAAKMALTVSGKFTILKNTASDVAETFGVALFPMVNKLLTLFQSFVDVAQKVATRFSQMSETSKNVTVGILGVVAAIGPALLALGTLITMAAAVGASLKFFGGITAVIALFKTLAAGVMKAVIPFALLVAKIILVAAVFAFFYANGQKVANGLSAAFLFLAGKVARAVEWIMEGLATLMSKIPKVGATIAASIRSAASSIGVMAKAAELAVEDLADKYAAGGGYIENTTNLLKSTLGAAWTSIVGMMAVKGEELSNKMKPSETVLTAWQTFAAEMKLQTESITEGAKQAFLGMSGGITEMLTGGTTTWLDLMNSFLKAMLNSIVDAVLKSMLSLKFLAQAFAWIGSNPFLAAVGIIGLMAGAKAVSGSFQGTKLAEGGITTGPTNALIGDNPSGKEAVIPLDSPRAAAMLGGGAGSQTIMVMLDGKEITRAVVRGMPNELRVHGMMRS